MIWMNVLKLIVACVVVYFLYKVGVISKLFKWVKLMLGKLDSYNTRNKTYNKDAKARKKYINKMINQINRSGEI